MNNGYSLLPGTNQLIRNNPDEGARLFRKHGYNIPHPKYRDYYNMLRHRHKGMSFYNDLTGVLQGLFGVASVIAGAKAAQPAREKNIVSGHMAGIDQGDLTSSLYHPISMPGASSFTGHDQARRIKDYHRLIKHLEHEVRRERDPRYLQNITYMVGFPVQAAQPDYQQDYDPGQSTLPDDTLFGFNKKLVIAVAIIAAIVIYVKFIK